MTQGGKERGGLPAGERDLADQSLATAAAAVQAGHVVLGPGLVDEHQPCRIEGWLRLAPLCTSLGDVRSVLLSGAQTFF